MPKRRQHDQDGAGERVLAIGQQHRQRWERAARQDPDAQDWARRLVETLTAEEVHQVIARYRRMARDKRIDDTDRTEARQRAAALAILAE
jgi:uncharacterized Zn finger protein (UPF0148 family)